MTGDTDSSTDNNVTSNKIHHQLTRSVIGSPSQISQMTTAAAMLHQQQQPQHYEQSNYIFFEHSPINNTHKTATGAIGTASASSVIQPGPFAQSPEYMSVQDLITNHHHQINACVSPNPIQCFQSQNNHHHSPPTHDVALVEDLRFCFSLRKGAENSNHVERNEQLNRTSKLNQSRF